MIDLLTNTPPSCAERQSMPGEGFLMRPPENEKQEILGVMEIEGPDRRFVASL